MVGKHSPISSNCPVGLDGKQGALIRQSLEQAGWLYEYAGPLTWLDSGVSDETGHNGRSQEARALVEALNEEGIVAKQVIAEKYNDNPKRIVVVVGKKPPTSVELPGSGLP